MYLVFWHVPLQKLQLLQINRPGYITVSARAHASANTCVLSASEHLQAILHAHIGSLYKAFCVANVQYSHTFLFCVWLVVCASTQAQM